MREQIIRLAGKRHVCSGAALALLGERGWGADAHAAEAALVAPAWCAASISVRDSALVYGDPHGDCASVVADVRDLAVALVGRAVDSVPRASCWPCGTCTPPPPPPTS
jgi:hypothetical protein